GVVLLIAYWPWVRNHWDRLTGSRTGLDAAVSLDTEYWCPMCPGVLSDWPARCPVCHMDLVRRKKGEPVPLPDGVVARMQFTPSRVHLAGIRTAPAEFRPLAWEATCGGRLEASRSERLEVKVDVPRDGLAAVRPGLTADVECDARSGEKFRGRVQVAGPDVDPQTQTIRVLLTVDDERQELRPGLFVTVRFRVPLTRLVQSDRLAQEAWRD